jgi:hypothetical protein
MEIYRQTHRLSLDKTRTIWKMTRQIILLLLHVFVAAGTCLPSRCLAQDGGVHLAEPLPCDDRRDTHADIETDERDLWSTRMRWAEVPWYCHVFRVFVTNNNGFWIWKLDLLTLLYNYTQLWQLIISDCLRLAYSLLDHKRLLFHCDEWRKKNSCSHHELPWTTSLCRTNLEEFPRLLV